MSVFTNNSAPACEICHQRPCEEKKFGFYKSRCTYCKARYDRHGEPFILHCTTYRLERERLSQAAVVIWEMDGRVAKVPKTYGQFKGRTIKSVLDWFTQRGWKVVYKNEASL